MAQTTQLGMVIDLRRCIGCHTCAVACKSENNLPNGIWWNRTLTEGGASMDIPAGVYPDLTMRKLPIACQHCANPACTKVCPVQATYKDPDTGVVHQDYDKCLGCRMCMAACPFTGVRSFNWEEPAYAVAHAVGGEGVPAHQKHTVEKCTLCSHRVPKGEEPACIAPCPGRARFFGDLNDPDSDVARLVRDREHMQLLKEQGTDPSVYYLT